MSHVDRAGSAGNAAANLHNQQDANTNTRPSAAVAGLVFQGGTNGAPPTVLRIASTGLRISSGNQTGGAGGATPPGTNPMAGATANPQRGADAVPTPGMGIEFEGLNDGAAPTVNTNDDPLLGTMRPEAAPADADDERPPLPDRPQANRGRPVGRAAARPATATLVEMPINRGTAAERRDTMSSLLVQDPHAEDTDDTLSDTSSQRPGSIRSMGEAESQRISTNTVASTESNDTVRMGAAPPAAPGDTDSVYEENMNTIQEYLNDDMRRVDSDFVMWDQDTLDQVNEDQRQEQNQWLLERMQAEDAQPAARSFWSRVGSFFSGFGDVFSRIFSRG